MNVDTIQELIDKTDYWDMRILDVTASYFGDEVKLLIENDEVTCWRISFLSCYKVSYNTDADRRKISKVKSMRKSQLGYYGQNITVCKSNKDNFYKVDLDLSIMEMQIELIFLKRFIHQRYLQIPMSGVQMELQLKEIIFRM